LLSVPRRGFGSLLQRKLQNGDEIKIGGVEFQSPEGDSGLCYRARMATTKSGSPSGTSRNTTVVSEVMVVLELAPTVLLQEYSQSTVLCLAR